VCTLLTFRCLEKRNILTSVERETVIAWLSTLLTIHHIDLDNQASNYLGALQTK